MATWTKITLNDTQNQKASHYRNRHSNIYSIFGGFSDEFVIVDSSQLGTYYFCQKSESDTKTATTLTLREDLSTCYWQFAKKRLEMGWCFRGTKVVGYFRSALRFPNSETFVKLKKWQQKIAALSTSEFWLHVVCLGFTWLCRTREALPLVTHVASFLAEIPNRSFRISLNDEDVMITGNIKGNEMTANDDRK